MTSCKECEELVREIYRLKSELEKVISTANERIKISEGREAYLQSRFLEMHQELTVLRETKGLNLEMLTLSAKTHAPC